MSARGSERGGSADPIVHRAGRDDAILIKPAGRSVELPADAGGGADGVSVLAWARRRWPDAQPRLPHRLDRLARGILVVALSDDAAKRHAATLRAGRWRKIYIARIASAPETLLGTHHLYLRRRGRRAEIVRSGGDPARLEVLAAAPAPGFPTEHHAIVRLLTGRYHQVRATLAHLGAPVSGDPLYDPLASRRAAPPMLEHAMLSFPRLDDPDALEIVWRPEDPERERLAPRLTSLLRGLARPAS